MLITQTHSILALVSAGFGVALVPESAGHCLPDGVVLRRLARPETAKCDLVGVWQSDTERLACEALVKVALEFDR